MPERKTLNEDLFYRGSSANLPRLHTYENKTPFWDKSKVFALHKDKIKSLTENETYKYLGILEADNIKQAEMKEKIQKEYLRRTRKLLEKKLNSRNLIKGINTWAVPLVRYSGPFLERNLNKWTKGQEN